MLSGATEAGNITTSAGMQAHAHARTRKRNDREEQREQVVTEDKVWQIT